jgi:hypothetical protein
VNPNLDRGGGGSESVRYFGVGEAVELDEPKSFAMLGSDLAELLFEE